MKVPHRKTAARKEALFATLLSQSNSSKSICLIRKPCNRPKQRTVRRRKITSRKTKTKRFEQSCKLFTSYFAVSSSVDNYNLHITVDKVEQQYGSAATEAHLSDPYTHESLASNILCEPTIDDAKDMVMSVNKTGFRGQSISKNRHHIVPSLLKPIKCTLSSTPVTDKEDVGRRSANFANVSSIPKVSDIIDTNLHKSEVDKYVKKLRLESGCKSDSDSLSILSVASCSDKENEFAEMDCQGACTSGGSSATFGQKKTLSSQCLPESCQTSSNVESGVDLFPDYASTLKALQALRIAIGQSGNRLTNNVDVQSPKKEEANCIPAPTFLEKILELCGQTEVLTWKKAFPASQLWSWKKIGEGSFCEAFLGSFDQQECCIKVIPISRPNRRYAEVESSSDDVVPEILISSQLSALSSSDSCWHSPNLPRLHGVRCVKGKYPAELLKAWDQFALNNQTESNRPDHFTADQHYVLLCMENGGVSLENFKLTSLEEAKSILQQMIFTLALLEKALKFEHRDLHVSNILVRGTKVDYLEYIIDGDRLTVPSAGLLCCMVDFTLSRLQIDDQVIYADLSSHSHIFSGSGDMQFYVYPLMREIIGSSWETFNPKTNVLWIAYLADFLAQAKYRNRKLPQAKKARLFAFKRRTKSWGACSAALSIKALFS